MSGMASLRSSMSRSSRRDIPWPIKASMSRCRSSSLSSVKSSSSCWSISWNCSAASSGKPPPVCCMGGGSSTPKNWGKSSSNTGTSAESLTKVLRKAACTTVRSVITLISSARRASILSASDIRTSRPRIARINVTNRSSMLLPLCY